MSERGKLLQHLVRTGERGAAIDDPLAAPRRRHAQAAGAYTYDVHTEGERGGSKNPPILRIFSTQDANSIG